MNQYKYYHHYQASYQHPKNNISKQNNKARMQWEKVKDKMASHVYPSLTEAASFLMAMLFHVGVVFKVILKILNLFMIVHFIKNSADLQKFSMVFQDIFHRNHEENSHINDGRVFVNGQWYRKEK